MAVTNNELSQRLDLSCNSLKEAKQFLNSVAEEINDETDKQDIKEGLFNIDVILNKCQEISKSLQ